jgi:hypothetical protein
MIDFLLLILGLITYFLISVSIFYITVAILFRFCKKKPMDSEIFMILMSSAVWPFSIIFFIIAGISFLFFLPIKYIVDKVIGKPNI